MAANCTRLVSAGELLRGRREVLPSPVPGTVVLTVEQAQRRFVFLTGLRWLPVGFLAPVVVLLASSRGLSATDIGLVFTVQGGLVVALELPTGGLADTLGRRPVLLLSGLLNVAALLALVAAQELSGFLVAGALLGIARALDSGPLEAWFVDAVQRADPAAGATAGFAQAGVVTGVALAVGAATGGLLPRLFDGQLAAPVLTAAAFTAVQSLLVLLLVVPTGRSGRLDSLAGTLRAGLVAVPATVRAASTLAREDPVLRVLVLMSFGVGAVLNTVELLAPLRFADLLGGQTQASGVYGAVVALGFAGGAAGSALTQRARRLARGSTPLTMAAAHLLGAVAFAVFAAGSTSVVLAVAYAVSYVANAWRGRFASSCFTPGSAPPNGRRWCPSRRWLFRPEACCPTRLRHASTAPSAPRPPSQARPQPCWGSRQPHSCCPVTPRPRRTGRRSGRPPRHSHRP